MIWTPKCLLLAVFLFSGLFVFGASVDTVDVFSLKMRKEVRCVVVSPEENSEHIRHAVVYLLHGYSGNYASWLHIAPQIKTWVDQTGTIVVCPDGANSWYFDSPLDSSVRYETFVSSELVRYIDSNYRTVRSAKARAIAGLSMGGHGALYLAIRHPDVFGAAGSMSGGVDFTPFPENWEIKNALGNYASDSTLWKANTVLAQVDSLHDGELNIIVDCGVDDFFITVNRDLHKKLLEKKIGHDYIERPGGHTLDYWQNAVNYQLLYFQLFFNASNLKEN